MIESSVMPLDGTGSEIEDDITSYQTKTKQEAEDYIQDVEQDADEVESLSEALEIVSAAVESMKLSGLISVEEVASFEALKPGVMLSDYDIVELGGPLNPNSYNVTLEQGVNFEFDLVMVLMSKFFKLTFKATERLNAVAVAFMANKAAHAMKGLIGSSIREAGVLPSVRWDDLSTIDQKKLAAATQRYTGFSNVGEKEVLTTIAAVKSSSSGIEIMGKLQMPKYNNIILSLFEIPTTDYNGILNFFDVHASKIVPKIETNLNVTINEMESIIAKRNWAKLSQFDVSMYGESDKNEIYKLANHVKVKIDKNGKFRRQLSKLYGATSLLFENDSNRGIQTAKLHQSLPSLITGLESMKDDVITISDVLQDMTKKSESKSQQFAKELRKFRASKTIKESFKQGRTVNRYSNAAYSRIMGEIRDVAYLSTFMSTIGVDVLNAYTKIYTRVNKLNTETSRYIEDVLNIIGAS